MTVGELLQAIAPAVPQPATTGGRGTLAAECTGVTHDSRQVTPGVVFVALRGLRADGAAFAPQAIAAGAAAVVAEAPAPSALAVPWIVVADARLALALLAAEFFGHPSREMR